MAVDPFKDLDEWKQSLLRLPENKFLDIVKMYCGPIKTPYNKEKLLKDLFGFLYRRENRETLLKILSNNDILFLNAINFIPDCTVKNLQNFFENSFSILYVHDYIANLEERQLVYKTLSQSSKREILVINPLFLEFLQPEFKLSILVPRASVFEFHESQRSSQKITASLFAAWYSFVCMNPDLCRADGTFKKKVLELLSTSFFGIDTEFLLLLNTALVNLGLFYNDGNVLVPNEKKWENFASLSPEIQSYYILIASFSRFQRDVLLKNIQLVNNIVENIPPQGLEKQILFRLLFLLKNQKKVDLNAKKDGFFAKILQNAQSAEIEEFSEKALIERMVFFGILETIEESQMVVYRVMQKKQSHYVTNSPFISINAGFSVTLLAEPPLKELLPLIGCMNIVRYDTVCQFEITRQSCMRNFDKGENSENILLMLEKASGSSVSQNLVFSLNEWFTTFNSASLYHGYVLQVSDEKIVHIENSPILAPHIKKVIAPGIYLFDFDNRDEIMSAIEKSTLDFIGTPKSIHTNSSPLPFQDCKNPTKLSLNYDISDQKESEEWENHAQAMKDELQKLNLPTEQKEALSERINRKLILNSAQLVGETVRIEKTEASGIDFLGKVKVLEQAISSSNLVEVQSATNSYIGRPIKIEKRDGDAVLSLAHEDGKIFKLLIGQARNVRRFRQPLF